MKKIIPFKKKLTFKTNVSEITSISLENTLQCSDNIVDGDLIINGSYKITDTSIKIDDFEFKIPVNIEMDDKYITDNIIIDIDDFYYEIINNNILEVNIDISLDNLIEKPIIEQVKEEIKNRYVEEEIKMDEVKPEVIVLNERCIDEDENVQIEKKIYNEVKNVEVEKQVQDEVNIFSSFLNDSEEYSTYYVYIVREGDTLDSIMTKYQVTKEKMSEYNDISELKLGDKLIIPQINV